MLNCVLVFWREPAQQFQNDVMICLRSVINGSCIGGLWQMAWWLVHDALHMQTQHAHLWLNDASGYVLDVVLYRTLHTHNFMITFSHQQRPSIKKGGVKRHIKWFYLTNFNNNRTTKPQSTLVSLRFDLHSTCHQEVVYVGHSAFSISLLPNLPWSNTSSF